VQVGYPAEVENLWGPADEGDVLYSWTLDGINLRPRNAGKDAIWSRFRYEGASMGCSICPFRERLFLYKQTRNDYHYIQPQRDL